VLPVFVALVVLYMLTKRQAQAADKASLQSGARLIHLERAVGIHPTLFAALQEWERSGPFPLTVGVKGGLRTALDQLELWAKGRTAEGNIVTNAMTPEASPHGRGGAVDLWPLDSEGAPLFDESPATLQRYDSMARWFRQRGFHCPLTLGDGTVDRPHVQLTNWRALPYPPPDYTLGGFSR
jgi:hypothetical protein